MRERERERERVIAIQNFIFRETNSFVRSPSVIVNNSRP